MATILGDQGCVAVLVPRLVARSTSLGGRKHVYNEGEIMTPQKRIDAFRIAHAKWLSKFHIESECDIGGDCIFCNTRPCDEDPQDAFMLLLDLAEAYLEEVEYLRAHPTVIERDEARHVAAILIHAYDTGNSPPEHIVGKARDWQYKNKEKPE